VNVVVTGAAGFLGQRLAKALLDPGQLAAPDGSHRQITRLTLVDLTAPAAVSDPRVATIEGDVADPAVVAQAVDADTDSVFHLAAVVSGMAEAEFDLGMRVNLDATRLLLDRCRAGRRVPRFVFTSSVAVYGGPLPDVVRDATAVRPQSSYGAQKAIGELLIEDYSRKGFVDGRVLRLPTVSVRPGRPNAAASSFASGIIREPLAGEDAVCPVDPDTRLWLISPETAVMCLIAGHDLPASAFGHTRTVNLPGLSTTPREMAAALARVAGPETASRIRWHRQPAIERIVTSWPGAWDNTRAQTLGFPHDETFEAAIRSYLQNEAPSIRTAKRG
jgi:D-erythronate 2-dehydrogenase